MNMFTTIRIQTMYSFQSAYGLKKSWPSIVWWFVCINGFHPFSSIGYQTQSVWTHTAQTVKRKKTKYEVNLVGNCPTENNISISIVLLSLPHIAINHNDKDYTYYIDL